MECSTFQEALAAIASGDFAERDVVVVVPAGTYREAAKWCGTAPLLDLVKSAAIVAADDDVLDLKGTAHPLGEYGAAAPAKILIKAVDPAIDRRAARHIEDRAALGFAVGDDK